jgi:uncharacterized YigZ family protein
VSGRTEYISLAENICAEISVKKSRFICDLLYVENEGKAASEIGRIKKTHHSARHHCSAMIIGADRSFVKMSDDGEPQGTAGLPMLEVLKGSGLTNILAVVTRYFGGTLLGTGGLKRAYTDSVKEALLSAKTIQNIPADVYTFQIDYKDYGKLQTVASEFGATMEGDFEEKVTVDVTIRADKTQFFLKKAAEAFMGEDVFSKTAEKYIKIWL